LVTGFAVGLAGTVLGTETEPCCHGECCQWILISPCCDLFSAIPSQPPVDLPLTLAGRAAEPIVTRPIDLVGLGGMTTQPIVPLGLRTTVLRL
jgi:hypothetical protein